MPAPLSLDLRERLFEAVESALSLSPAWNEKGTLKQVIVNVTGRGRLSAIR